jgi:hypothetical protein
VALLTLLAFLFLALLAALCLVSFKVFAARDPQGNLTAPGCLNGCAFAALLSVVGLLGVAAFACGVVTISAAESVERVTDQIGDVDIGLWHDREERVQHVDGFPLHVVLEWKGYSEPTSRLVSKLEELGGGNEMHVRAEYSTNAAGEEITVVDIAFRADGDDIADLERELSEALPGLSLDEGIEITLRKRD